MTTYKLFIDDIRDCPEGFVLARSIEDARDIVSQYGFPIFISLDHDLGPDSTIMEFLHWLAGNYYDEGAPQYLVHSANPVGRANIIAFMTSWDKSLSL